MTTQISTDLLERVLDRFGLGSSPSLDQDGLDLLYAAWCAHVPFDNTRKLIAVRGEGAGPLPGIEPTDFLETWLEHGTGGTCWPSCNALFAVLDRCGFDAARATASMLDLGQPNHGTIIVRLDDAEYLVDSSMLLNRAIELRPGETVIDPDPLKPMEYETIDDSVRMWFEFPTQSAGTFIPCRLLTVGVSHWVFREAYEASREMSPFNHQLYATRNLSDRVELFHGRHQVTRLEGGTREVTDHDAGSLKLQLMETLGLSPRFVEQWAASGALEDSLEERQAADRPPMTEVPPSLRR